MAYDALKTEIRQYINTNGQEEITGQILQNVLLDMVNAYPSLDGYATQLWVQNQIGDMATMTWVGNQLSNYASLSWVGQQLSGYLPLMGGTLTGSLGIGMNPGLTSMLSVGGNVDVNGDISLGMHGSQSEYYPHIDMPISTGGRIWHDLIIGNIGDTYALMYIKHVSEGPDVELILFDMTGNITAQSFIVSDGTSAQFLKADGSVDNNTYLTSAAISDMATQTWVGQQGFITSSALNGYIHPTLSNLANGDILIYDSVGTWVNTPLSSLLNGYATQTWVGQQGFITSSALNGYIHPTLSNLANGDILIYDSVGTWVNTPLSSLLNGYATQTWVGQQGFVTSSALSSYLPLTGGTLTGSLGIGMNPGLNSMLSVGGNVDVNGDISLGMHGSQSEYYPHIDMPISTGGRIGYSLRIGNTSDTYALMYIKEVSEGADVELILFDLTGNITAQSFIMDGGTSSQFLKADGSVDSNTYITRSPSYHDFEQSSSYEESYIYNDRVVGSGQIFTQDMILPAGRWTYSFNLIGEDGVWFGDGTTQITVRNRETGAPIDKINDSYDAQDAYNNASRYWVSFYLPQMTAVRIELDDPANATLYMYRPCLNMGYNRMKIL